MCPNGGSSNNKNTFHAFDLTASPKTKKRKSSASHSHMGADFFPEGGKNTFKFVVPPKMALGEGILFPFVGEG